MQLSISFKVIIFFATVAIAFLALSHFLRQAMLSRYIAERNEFCLGYGADLTHCLNNRLECGLKLNQTIVNGTWLCNCWYEHVRVELQAKPFCICNCSVDSLQVGPIWIGTPS